MAKYSGTSTWPYQTSALGSNEEVGLLMDDVLSAQYLYMIGNGSLQAELVVHTSQGLTISA